MSKIQNIFKQKKNIYYIIFLSVIIFSFLILNSKFKAEKRTHDELNKEAEIKFNKILNIRNLESFEEGMNKICNKGSEELKNYYLTGVIDKIDEQINKEKNNNSTENPEYVDALIDILKSSTGEAAENGLSDNAMIYGKHILGIIVFLAITILSIPGWMICCSCCCCNCCCCCCCTSPKCKTPFFVITILLYLLVIAICIYGLVKSNSIFKGLADTECSVLLFCNEVIEGETKEEKPKWVGITGIVTLLDSVQNKINSLGNDKLKQLQKQNDTIIREKKEFEDLLQKNSDQITKGDNFKEINGVKYRLDITSKETYGEFDITERKGIPEKSFVNMWYKEYSATAENSEKYIGEATEKFNQVLAPNEENDVIKSVDTIKNNVQDIGNSINDIKNGIGDAIIEFSNYIDEYGKLFFKILYAILIVIVCGIAFFMILLGFCSGKLCNCCCCARMTFKVFIHILWNILALLMIITFLIGFILSFVGTIGSDMVYVINFFISEDNLSKDEPAIFGNEGKKLNKCFNGEGDILNDLGLNLDDIGSFDKLNEINEQIEIIEQNFTELKQQKGTYSIMVDQLNERKNYNNLNFKIVSDDLTSSYTLSDELSNLNSDSNVNEEWSFSCNPSSGSCKNPKTVEVCSVYNTESSANTIGKRIDAITNLVNIANNGDNSMPNNYKTLTDGLKTKYDIFLDEELGTLRIFNETIKSITGIFDDYIGKGGKVFDFVNCKFIGTNIQIILKNLKDNLGGDFYTVGICLLIAGCSMGLAICFTILLVIILNNSVEENKNESKN